MTGAKTQRVRDPIHGLIVFRASDPVDRLAWSLLNTREFQRLRRIRQLGFSELVFPGATHTRFSHCIGAYHTARQLVAIIGERGEARNETRERAALLAALLHDVGHGPFSHVFEEAAADAGRPYKHEEMSAEIVRGDTEIRRILDAEDAALPDAIATILLEEEAKDIYATVVSSQFDADRLDYLRRDRLMTGVEFGHVDADWLFDCLRVGTKTLGTPEEPRTEPCLYLSPKGIRVAEEYLEARFRLYAMVYMHKTTRAAERMLGRLLTRLSEVAKSHGEAAAPVWLRGRLSTYFGREAPSLSDFLALDDSVVLAEIARLCDAPDADISDLAKRLRDRKLYKCFDLGERLQQVADESRLLRFYQRLMEKDSEESGANRLTDRATHSIYKWYDSNDRSALSMVLVKRQESDTEPLDIGTSPIIRALREREKIERLYVPKQNDLPMLEKAWKESE
jgi:hypothetical protein